ncbi:GATA transcription factor 9-like [Macadamia integrifolia]|uniref:GATA transcription factor 9-like n=1 Tax=Macadamia integrifolia TaxID=60698 RepID=UPI001C4F4AC3|nr:GATA transcription factor 9-like [Macadamia integrifolia]
MEAPELFHTGYCRTGNSQFTTEIPKSGDHFFIDDLLDFSNEDAILNDGTFVSGTGNSTDSSTVTAVDSCNSSFSGGGDLHFSGNLGCRNFTDAHFSGDLCVPYDDLAELEWLSNFVEESFSSEDLQKLQLISGMKARTNEASETNEFHQPESNMNHNDNNQIFRPELSVPGKARSKRSRAAPINWSSRLLVLSPTSSSSESDVVSSSGKKTPKGTMKKKESLDNAGGSNNWEGRKCLHCATDKTPQWRTGPMGPKTLCNACGVRYKSGRLVPEYRPAASPTFVLTKHSNSHRKVIELRRQKELQEQHQQQQFLHPNTVFDMSSSDDYLIHHHPGPDFRQLI